MVPRLLALLPLLLLVEPCLAANILIMPSSLQPVHRFTMRHLAGELLKRNHSVTWFEYGLVHRKEHIPLPKGVEEIFVKTESTSQALKDIYLHHNHTVAQQALWREDFWHGGEQSSGWLASIELCDWVLKTPSARKTFDALTSRRFDAVVVDDLYNPCGLLHTGLQRSVFVYWSMTGLRVESAWAHQSPSPPSYLPVAGSHLTDELSFWQRTYNLGAYLKQLYIHQHLVLRRVDALAQRHFAKERLPDAFLLERNASINFVNHPPIFDFARPYMPRVNFVGGLHCRKAKNLTGKLEAFVSAANDQQGFILISSGFSAQWKYALANVTDALLSAMRALPDTRFVWQYNGPALSDPPANLHTAEWLPQQDLLGHAKCRAHVSHGGLNSLIESVWHGVPVIGWPLTSSGYDNLLRVTARQAGLMLEHKQPSKQELVSALHRIYIRHYKEEALLFQDMVTDVPYTELNHSAFWVEFIVRHQEVPHARSGADDLNILQYFLVDVVAFLLGVVALALAVVYYALKLALQLLVRGVQWLLARGKAAAAAKPHKHKEPVSAGKKKN